MTPKPKPMVVAGVMSGTSADGVDVALVRIAPRKDRMPRIQLLGHSEFRYPRPVRERVLRLAGGAAISAQEISRLNWRLGEIYAESIEKACIYHDLMPTLIGLHGQTVFHAGAQATWQLGEPAPIAARLAIPVVSDFRPSDIAAGGQGAPLVPMLDFCLFASKTRNRILLNLGGIANMTIIPAAASLQHVIAFDSGPANMLLDALMQRYFAKSFDRGGKTAARGRVVEPALAILLALPYFAQPAPKSCGREQFGAPFVERLIQLCDGATPPDLIATAAELTVRSIYDAYRRIARPLLSTSPLAVKPTDLIVAGGGTRNPWLMARLQQIFEPLGIEVLIVDDLGIPSQAKEAVAFALLAWLSWHGLPGNVPSATGAAHPVVLGKISPASVSH
jgi:anhydro-N-acetylmuramic acid kinase